jgi:hypothetical protein
MPLPITKNEKICMIHQVYSLFAEHGVEGISMDEVAKQIRISKATIYKYFKSKEDIVHEIVNERITQLNGVQFTTDKGINGILESISSIYFEGVVTGAYSSSKFLKDLESKFPNILSDYITALDFTQKRFACFFDCAVQKGFCKQVSIHLVGLQAKMMLPIIIKPGFSEKNNTAIPSVIKEYYKLLLCQILSVEYMDAIILDSTYLFVDELVELLKSRFLID